MSSPPHIDHLEPGIKLDSDSESMNTTGSRKSRIDIGRVLMVPFCGLVVLLNAFVIHRSYNTASELNALEVLSRINAVLVCCFYFLMAAVYLWRTSAHRTSNSLSVNAIAVAASFLTVPLLVLNANVKSGMLLMLIGAIVGTAGLGFSIFSIYSLGKSFSIIPQAREFVHQGPYQYIRHPLYLGEIVSAAGFVLAHLSLTMLSILAMLFVMQAFRAVVEEKILAGTFPEYKTYMAKTWRFVPRVY